MFPVSLYIPTPIDYWREGAAVDAITDLAWRFPLFQCTPFHFSISWIHLPCVYESVPCDRVFLCLCCSSRRLFDYASMHIKAGIMIFSLHYQSTKRRFMRVFPQVKPATRVSTRTSYLFEKWVYASMPGTEGGKEVVDVSFRRNYHICWIMRTAARVERPRTG